MVSSYLTTAINGHPITHHLQILSFLNMRLHIAFPITEIIEAIAGQSDEYNYIVHHIYLISSIVINSCVQQTFQNLVGLNNISLTYVNAINKQVNFESIGSIISLK